MTLDFHVWLAFALTEAAFTVVPGPAVLFVVSQALRSGSRGSLGSALGILGANTLCFAISGTGVGALLLASSSLFTSVRWAGAGYLLYLGVTAFLRSTPIDASPVTVERTSLRLRDHVVRGFLVQMSNPKALLFFVAVLPQFIDRSRPIALQLLVFGATSIVFELAVLSAYGGAAARASRFALKPRFAAATSRLSGALLIGAALGLVRLDPDP